MTAEKKSEVEKFAKKPRARWSAPEVSSRGSSRNVSTALQTTGPQKEKKRKKKLEKNSEVAFKRR